MSDLPDIRMVWRKLNLPGDPPADKKDSHCPFGARHAHGDRRPSFALLDGATAYCCHGCGSKGGVIAFTAEAQQVTLQEAARWLRVHFPPDENPTRSATVSKPAPRPEADAAPEPKQCRFRVPALSVEKIADLRRQAAESRGLSVETFALAEIFNVVRYGTDHGKWVWILSSSCGRVHEARRITGERFELGNAKTLSCCNPGGKRWPVGLNLMELYPHSAILFCEGSADFMAGLEVASDIDYLIPVAVLGSAPIHPAALPSFRGRTVLIAADPGEKGRTTAAAWAAQLKGAAAKVGGFQADLDLNDAIRTEGIEAVRQIVREHLNQI